MAALSTADKAFITAMTTHHTAAIAAAKDFLKAPPGDRRAALSDMARNIIKQNTTDMMQMSSMMGSGAASA